MYEHGTNKHDTGTSIHTPEPPGHIRECTTDRDKFNSYVCTSDASHHSHDVGYVVTNTGSHTHNIRYPIHRGAINIFRILKRIHNRTIG
jgi:hypothetical protein